MPIYRCAYWLIDSADWSVDPEDASFRSPRGDAELRIDTYDFVGADSWRDLVSRFESRAPEFSPIEGVTCGPFAGGTFASTDEDGRFRREWLLGLADLALFVTLTCTPGLEAETMRAVAPILASLADNRA